jgi:hypothetical protein
MTPLRSAQIVALLTTLTSWSATFSQTDAAASGRGRKSLPRKLLAADRAGAALIRLS